MTTWAHALSWVLAAIIGLSLLGMGLSERQRGDKLQRDVWRLESERNELREQVINATGSVANLEVLLMRAQEQTCPEPVTVQPKREAKRVTPVFPYAKSVQ